MATIDGTFSFGGLPRNDVPAKLWPAGRFSSAPEKGTALPSGSPTDSTTTAESHGGDGAYRFEGVADGAYYVSFEYAGEIAYEYQCAGPQNVRDYFAVGDGAADDATALQAAITAVSGGGTVYLPPGNYRITTGLTIPSSNIRIVGAGKITTKITFAGASGTALKSSDQSTSRIALGIEHLSFIGSGGTAVGVDLKSFSDSHMTQVEINGFATQLNLDGSVAGFWNTYNHCKFFASGAASGQVGVNFGQSANRHTFIGCRFARLDRQVVIGDGVAAPGPNDIHFLSCSFDLADTACIDIVRGVGIHINGGRFEGNNICLRVPGTSIAREIVFAPDHVSPDTNTTVISGGNYGLTVRGGATGLPYHLANGYSQTPAPNRVANALMEGWASASDLMGWSSISTTNWDTSGMETREAVVLRSGTYSAKIGDGSNANRGISMTARIKVRADMPYTFSLAFAAPATDQGIRWGFRCYDSGGAVITTGSVQSVLTNAPELGSIGSGTHEYSAALDAHIVGANILPALANTYERRCNIVGFPSGTVEIRIGIWAVGNTTGLYAYVDEVFFGEGPSPFSALARAVGDSGDQPVYGKLLASSGIGVGNSAAATIPGSVTRKIEIFDASGASLGFLPVYDAIA